MADDRATDAETPNVRRIVLDTNLFVASLFNRRSASHRLLELAREGRVRMLWSEPVKRELVRILGNVQRAARRDDYLSEVLAALFHEENKVADPPPVRMVAEDPEDDTLLACALGGRADMLVSNDRHLLELGSCEGIPIVTPGEAVRRLAEPLA
jgi:putative PIN family toxin of toxin-antitoxin system